MAIKTFTAGDSISETVTLSNYPASSGWILHWYITKTGARYAITGTASGDDHLMQADATETAAWKPGEYTLVQRVEMSGTVTTVSTEPCQVNANPLAEIPPDLRSDARIMLEAIDAALRKAATAEQLHILQTRHNVTELQQDFEKLLKLRQYYRDIVRNEDLQEAINQGAGDASAIRISFR